MDCDDDDDTWNASQMPFEKPKEKTSICPQTIQPVATTTVFKKPVPRAPKRSSTTTTAIQETKWRQQQLQLPVQPVPCLQQQQQQQQSVLTGEGARTLCALSLSCLEKHDLLFFRKQILAMLDKSKEIPVFMHNGFQNYSMYSYCVHSQTQLKPNDLFFHDVRLYEVGDPLGNVYVCAWTEQKKSCILAIAHMFAQQPKLAMDLLHFTLCVRKHIVVQ